MGGPSPPHPIACWAEDSDFPTPPVTINLSATRKMSRNNGKEPKMDLKLNLSAMGRSRGGPSRAVVDEGSPTSPAMSCVSSISPDSSPEAASMVVAGCPRCLMYVMLLEKDPKICPKCKSNVLVDFSNDGRS